MFAFQRFVKLPKALAHCSGSTALMVLPMVRRSLALKLALASLLSLASIDALAEWRPGVEPEAWQSRRTRLLPGDGWIFMEALETPAVQAAEYIRSPQAVNGSVEVEAGLLLKRDRQDGWSSKVLPMRANCAKGELERRNSNGDWTVYPGRDGTVVKVRWICALR